jgi:divalent metal cation (Fe/Co/Zn/Cd) transporter
VIARDGQTLSANALLQRGLRLEYLTFAWNVVGAVVVIAAAWSARSVALAGFGLDSLIEILASVVVIWQLKGVGQGRERRAMRIIGVAFFALAVYVLIQAAFVLLSGARASPSLTGILWLTATLIAMLLLSRAKHETGRALGNSVLMAEAQVTLIDALLAAAVLIGLVLNAVVGWWWADPVAGLVIVYYGLMEGITAWRESA